MFQACLMVIPSQVVCFENRAEWSFCLAPFWCVAPGRRSGARLAQWRPSVVASFFCSRLVSCTCALLWMFISTHATALKPFIQNSHIHCTIFNIFCLEHLPQITARDLEVTKPKGPATNSSPPLRNNILCPDSWPVHHAGLSVHSVPQVLLLDVFNVLERSDLVLQIVDEPLIVQRLRLDNLGLLWTILLR